MLWVRCKIARNAQACYSVRMKGRNTGRITTGDSQLGVILTLHRGKDVIYRISSLQKNKPEENSQCSVVIKFIFPTGSKRFDFNPHVVGHYSLFSMKDSLNMLELYLVI